MIKKQRISSTEFIKSGSLSIGGFEAVNFIVSSNGVLSPLTKLKKVIELQNPHSLIHYNDIYLVCSISNNNDILYRIKGESATVIGILGGTIGKTWYAKVRDIVYISNGIYIRKYINGRLVELNSVVKESVEVPTITTYITDRLETYKGGKYLTFFGGRLFGARDGKVFYSEPFLCDFTTVSNVIDMSNTITAMRASLDRLFIGTVNGVYVAVIDDAQDFIFRITKLLDYACLDDGIITVEKAAIFITTNGIYIFDGQAIKKVGRLNSQFTIEGVPHYYVYDEDVIIISGIRTKVIMEGLNG